MKINEMNLEELAEYAVTLDGWDWRLVDGAKTREGRRMSVWAEDNNDVFVVNRDSENSWWRKGQVVGVDTIGTFVDSYCIHDGIDLNDPATLGCVLAMVRKKHGAWVYTLPTGRGWRVLIGNPEERFVSVVSAKEEMPTEAHALIAALAKTF